MLQTATRSSWPRQGNSLPSSLQKERKSLDSRKRKFVALWFCCFCGYGGMDQQIPACISCSNIRCNVCRWESHKKKRERGLYTRSKDAALRKDAALLSLTTTEPHSLSPPDLGNATTAVTCTTLKLGPTSCQLSSQQALHPGATPIHVTLQSLNEPDPHSHGDTQTAPTVGDQKESSLSFLTQVDAVDLIPDPSTSTCSVSYSLPDRTSSPLHQPDTVNTIIAIFEKWRSKCNITSHGSSGSDQSGSPNNSQPNQSPSHTKSRKRNSDQSSPSKQSGAKRPKVTNAPDPKKEKENKRRLACPFWKKDPIRHRKCYMGFTRMSYVKQDLKRHHRRPTAYCRRCGTDFGLNEVDFTEHSRADPQCDIRVFPDPDGMTSEQEKELGKYPDRRSTEEEQWYFMWKCLFPAGPDGEPPPPPPISPYVDQDLSEDMLSFREFSRREGWRTLASDPALGTFAYHVTEELFDRCLDRLYDTWLAKRHRPSQPTWEESPLTLSDTSSPDEMVPMNDAAWIQFPPGYDDMTALGDIAVDLNLATSFTEHQAYSILDSSVAGPNVDDDLAAMYLNFDHGF